MPFYPNQRLVNQLNRLTQEAYTDEALYYDEVSGTTGLDLAGQPTEDTTGVKLRCNFTDTIRNRQSLESYVEVGDIASIDAEIRFAEDELTPAKGGRFKLTKKYRNPTLVGVEYDVVSTRYRGKLGWVCALKKVVL